MSIQSIQRYVEQVQRDMASLNEKLADLSRKEAASSQRLVQLESSITKTTSASSVQSKMREMARIREEIARIQHDKADIHKRLAQKGKDLNRYQQELAREQDRERQKAAEAEKRRRREFEEYQQKLSQQLRSQWLDNQMRRNGTGGSVVTDPEYDLFISHASEDKEDFVRPLAQQLTDLGVKVWYDEFQLKVGDSLRRSIDRGLANSRYGIVVLSSAFFEKNWPQYELDGLIAREMDGRKVVLPIWHRVTKDEVMRYSPSLADKVALNSSLMSVEEIARELADVVSG